jgi:RNA polymerase sigma-70 factor (ECF subfamily)
MKVVDEAGRRFEAELLEKVGRGDEAAFAQLYDRLSTPLFSLVRQMTHDDAEAQDALSDGFTQIWRRASTYDARRSSAFTWAVTVVRNKTIDRIRIRQRVARVRERVAARLTLDDDVDAQSMLAPYLRERVQMVHKIILTLPDEQRTAVEMNFLEGLSHEEIAERLATPLGTVKARIRRALKKLGGVRKEDI